MKNLVDYSKYECPYAHLEKECGHELHGPEGYEDCYGVWCVCGGWNYSNTTGVGHKYTVENK